MMADRVEIDPAVVLGKPVIHGTRITVELILRKLSESVREPPWKICSTHTRALRETTSRLP